MCGKIKKPFRCITIREMANKNKNKGKKNG